MEKTPVEKEAMSFPSEKQVENKINEFSFVKWNKPQWKADDFH